MATPPGRAPGSSRSSVTSGSAASDATVVPRVGGVRCYWSLMEPRYADPAVPGSKLELVFAHPDPVLGVHLAKQKMSLMGRGLIEFIHPHEREQARRDLASAIAANDLQGSVTRVRFARLSRLKIILGCSPDEVDIPEGLVKVTEDNEYMVLDIVLNWVADGMLLAFFHAIKDMDSTANNDPQRAHEGWSNYCGTAHMPEEQIEALSANVAARIPIAPPTRIPPTRVFQIHTSSTSPVRPGQLVFSWPPPRPPDRPGRFDGLYNADEYIELMLGVSMDPATLPPTPGQVKTTCTTRFGAKFSMTSEGVYRVMESVFIPYGSLVFACFQTTKVFELSPRSSQVEYGGGPIGTRLGDWQGAGQGAGQQPVGHAQPNGQASMQGYVPAPLPTPPPSLPSSSSAPGMPSSSSHTSPSDLEQLPPLGMYQPLASGSGSGSASHAPPPIEGWQGFEPAPLDAPHANGHGHRHAPGDGRYYASQQGPPPLHSVDAMPTVLAPYSPRSRPPSLPSAEYGYAPENRSMGAHEYGQYADGPSRPSGPPIPIPVGGGADGMAFGSSQAAPPPTAPQHMPPAGHGSHPQYDVRPALPGAMDPLDPAMHAHQPRHMYAHAHGHGPHDGMGLHGHGPGDYYGPGHDSPPGHLGHGGGQGFPGGGGGGLGGGGSAGSSRPLIRPPGDVECCVVCGTRESPEWRRNESGIKDLCNACGLRLARQINKRNGKQKPRKKKTAV